MRLSSLRRCERLAWSRGARRCVALPLALTPVCIVAAHQMPSRCDSAALEPRVVSSELLSKSSRKEEVVSRWRRLCRHLMRKARLARRIARLAILAAPLVVTGVFLRSLRLLRRKPIQFLEEAWWALALRAVERAGPTFIKLCQWAATRNDLFPAAMTNRFSGLQDTCTPHSLDHTFAIFERAFGAEWRDHLDIAEDPQVLGSGCVAQVYKGTTNPDRVAVAVKVMHPGVREVVECDMALLRGLGNLLERNFPNLRYLAVNPTLAAFESLMSRQMDLGEEARNLRRLGALFKEDDTVIVPQPVELHVNFAPTDVLVEEFVEGRPIRSYVGSKEAETLAVRGARAVLRMVLQHNFVHGDLHPGNMLVTSDLRICFLDAGICVELDDEAHRNMVDILRAMLESRGRDAALLMMQSTAGKATMRERDSEQEERFAAGIATLVEDARNQMLFESIGDYYTNICSLAVRNHVALDTSFISISLAVKVMEGLVMDLKPDFALLELAMPMFLKAQFARASKNEMGKLSDYSKGILRKIKAAPATD